MLADERRSRLLEEIVVSGRVVTSEMSDRLGVSEVTIRGDLDDLERRGRVKRTRGGAVAPEAHSAIVSFDARMSINRDAKRRIAQAAAGYLKSDQTVIFDAGSTVHSLALHVPAHVSGLRVCTPGLGIAQHLMAVEGVSVFLMGGWVDAAWAETVGTPREQGIGDLLAHTLFLGAMAVDSDLDIVDNSDHLTRNKQQYARLARSTIVLLDSSKWGGSGSRKVLPLDKVDVIITDSGIDERLRERITTEVGAELLVV